MNSRRRKWAAIAAKGKTHYLVVRGVLGFGIGTTVLTLLWEHVSRGGALGTRQLFLDFLIRVPFYMFGG